MSLATSLSDEYFRAETTERPSLTALANSGPDYLLATLGNALPDAKSIDVAAFNSSI